MRLWPARAHLRLIPRHESVDTLAALSGHVRMAIVTTSKRDDFELIHAGRAIVQFMDFVLVREDYARSKPELA